MRFVGIFIVFMIFVISIPYSFAEEQIISIPKDSFNPNCQNLDLCYIPSPITVNVGQTVLWENNDSAVHTVTSGSPNSGPDGVIYSDLMAPGETFAFNFKEPGYFQYYCELHPWMEGEVTVQLEKDQIIQEEFDIIETRMSTDGLVLVTIKTNQPDSGNELPIRIEFTNLQGELIISMNYDITVIQDNEEVLFAENIRAVDGVSEFNTRILESDNPIDIDLGIRGIYSNEFTKDIQEVVKFQNIPEFGVLSMMILSISIIGIIVFNKTRLNMNNF